MDTNALVAVTVFRRTTPQQLRTLLAVPLMALANLQTFAVVVVKFAKPTNRLPTSSVDLLSLLTERRVSLVDPINCVNVGEVVLPVATPTLILPSVTAPSSSA